MFATNEEFAHFNTYSGLNASEHPEGHKPLRELYDKLGELAVGMRKYGFSFHIRRNPQNQGQKYESYHWAQLYPPYSKDSEGIICFVIDFTANGFGIHIDCHQRNGYEVTDESKVFQAWESIPVDEFCSLEKDEIINRIADYCERNKFNFLNFGKCYNIKSCIKLLEMETYKNLLLNNKNLILTGAPGTGKTYLAKRIAKALDATGERLGFVQFHPSYDYTDFIEGLRPVKDSVSGEIKFERKDGIFMSFCRNALKAYQASADKASAPKFVFIIDEINRGEISKIFGELFFSIDPGYRGVEGKLSTQYANLWTDNDVFDCTLEGDDKRKFYIPENVYVLATMNDIDRSVESMDFAMRRRFAFKEVTANARIGMISEHKTLSPHLKAITERMENLNREISLIPELNASYHVGPAYFLKLENYLTSAGLTEESWTNLWENHIGVLLYEYLRGVADSKIKLKKLYHAYLMQDE